MTFAHGVEGASTSGCMYRLFGFAEIGVQVRPAILALKEAVRATMPNLDARDIEANPCDEECFGREVDV